MNSSKLIREYKEIQKLSIQINEDTKEFYSQDSQDEQLKNEIQVKEEDLKFKIDELGKKNPRYTSASSN